MMNSVPPAERKLRLSSVMRRRLWTWNHALGNLTCLTKDGINPYFVFTMLNMFFQVSEKADLPDIELEVSVT